VSARRGVTFVIHYYALPEGHASNILEIDRSRYQYESCPDPNSLWREEWIPSVWQNPRFEYRRL
jgi:hypothetical protein